MTIPTFQAAKTLCNMSNWELSNLPLQKLLYLAHMVHLGMHSEPLIDGHFEAWDLGPVEPKLYHKVKAYGSSHIVDIFRYENLSVGKEFDTIKLVYEELKDSQPGQLVQITHWEKGAWAKHYKPYIGVIIPNEDILNEYQERHPK